MPTHKAALTHEELKKLLATCQESGAFDMVPHQNSNGADSYSCPACYGRTAIMGHAYGGGHLSEVEHEEGCCLVRLVEEINSWDERADP